MKSKTAKGKKSLASSSRPSPSKSAQSKSSSVKCAKGQISKIPSHARWSKITKVTAKRKRIVKSNCGKGKKTPSAPVSSSVTSQAHTVRSKDLEKERENASAKQADGIRKQVFILLHRPSGFEYFYHLFVVLLIITSCCVLNILKPKNPWDDIYIYNHYRTIHMAMCGVDSFLTVFLFAEMLTRFWAAEHNAQYCGLLGKWRYVTDHPYLAMDLFAFLTFFGYVIFNFATHTDAVPVKQLMEAAWWVRLDSAFRIAHVVQVLHTYRVIYKLVRPIFSTIYQQANQLLLAIFVVVIVMILCSVMVFLCNLSTAASSHHHSQQPTSHRPATDFTAAIWHCFVAFSTVGYDTHLPYSRESLAVLAACALVGVWSFMLPSIILGNGLSITVSEQRRMTFRYVSIAEMIRTTMAHHQTSRDHHHQQKASKKRKPQKERQLRLVTDHLHSLTKLDILKQPPQHGDRLLKINYDGFDSDEHSLADDDEALWDKLLTIDQRAMPGLGIAAQDKYVVRSPALPPLPSLNESLRTTMTFASNAARQQTKSNGGGAGTPQSGSTRVLDCFENMDLSKYSNDNSMLWYHLGLIEDRMDEMTDVVCNNLVLRVDQIHRLSSRLVASLAALKREVSTGDSR